MGNTVIQLRNETAATWTSNNPTLAQGEMGLETDTNRMKFGDGSTAWNSLPYVGAGASFKYGLYTLSADQTSNLAAGNHVEFNTTSGSLGGLATGSGQANGIITLTGGKSYKIMMSSVFLFSSNSGSYIDFQVYDRTNSIAKGIRYEVAPFTSSSYAYYGSPLLAIISPATNIDIDIRIIASANPSRIYSGYQTYCLIEEYGGY